jgi:hypothetical protein
MTLLRRGMPLVLLLQVGCSAVSVTPSSAHEPPAASAFPSRSPLPSPYENDAAVGFELILGGVVPPGVSFEITFVPPGSSRNVTFTFCPQEDRQCTGSGTVYAEGGGFQPKGGKLRYTYTRISSSGVRRTIAQGVEVLHHSETLRVRYRQ